MNLEDISQFVQFWKGRENVRIRKAFFILYQTFPKFLATMFEVSEKL